MVLTRAQHKRLSDLGMALEILPGVASDRTPLKTPLSMPENGEEGTPVDPEAPPVRKPVGALDYLKEAGIDIGGCDDELTIQVVEVGNTNICVEVPHSDHGDSKPKDPWGLDVHGAPGDDYCPGDGYDSDGLEEYFGGQIDYSYEAPPAPEERLFHDDANSDYDEASTESNGWGDNEGYPIMFNDTDTDDSQVWRSPDYF